VELLEKEFAAWLGVPHAVAAGFGRGALWLALRAAEVEGADVLVPEFICEQVPEVVARAGARVVEYPVERDLSVAPERFRAAMTPAARAAVVPHYFGRVLPQTEELARICRERSVVAIEDCALALGASRGRAQAGAFGDVAVFSFTKSGWCYGGGLAATRSDGLAGKMRALRGQSLRCDARRAFVYGLLRRMDFLANRPRWSGVAERAGRWVERIAGIREGNFYDAGRFDAAMSPRAAARARRILREAERDAGRRRRIFQWLEPVLREAPFVLPRPAYEPGDTGAFLVLRSPAGRADRWPEEAARRGIALRRTWPAFQDAGARRGDSAEWFANHLLVLEVHPRLSQREAERISACLRMLAARE
jgi:dTDP-4-amino-4,6-dideoxygalactose transaminase